MWFLDGLLNVFRDRFESLGGEVEIAKDREEAALTAVLFLRQKQAGSVFISAVPAEIERILTTELRKEGLVIFTGQNELNPVSVLKQVDAGISTSAAAIANTGTLVEYAFDDVERLLSSLPKIYVSFVKRSKLLREVRETESILRAAMEHPTSVVTFISGPSRSGDIEQRLMLGIHGPHSVLAVVLTWM
ncbi:MAG: LUD domain-containing protein [Candidatus Caldarchaeum sp.]